MPVSLDSQYPFALFGTAHLLTLAVVAALAAVVALSGRGGRHGWLAWAMALLLLAQEAVKLQVFIGELGQPWQQSLPLDLCRINELLCVVMLTTRSFRAFEVAYFWSMAGSVVAMLTPDLAQGFPHPLYLLFYLGHGLVVLAVVYAIAAWGFRPTLASLGMALAVTAGYAGIMALVNLALDANYLFLRGKPEAANVLDLFGPWPWYLPALFGLTALICSLCYLPFAIARRLAGSRGGRAGRRQRVR